MNAKKQVLSPSELASIKDEKNELETTIRNLERGDGAGTKGSQIDKPALKRHVEYLDKQLNEGSPANIRTATKDRLASRAKELEGEIKQGMPTYEQMWKPVKHPGIARKNKEWQKRTRDQQQEYKQIMRQLEPGDPSASSIERLRKR